MPETPSTEETSVVVEAHALTKVFKDFWGRPKARAVNGIDLTIRRGQVFGLLGPNGSGKSTTVKMLLGLLYPTRGMLKVLGESPRRVDTKRRIGYLPEDSYLYRYLTAAESLDFFGALFGMYPSERAKRSEQLLEMVGLSSARGRPVGEFSKGMARRIGLAQALINDPELVILDEPTAGLDPIGCREVKNLIRLLAERGKTVILCSHLLSDVEDVCDEVAVLYGGQLCAQGSLREMLKIEEKTRIVAPRLEPGQLEQVLATLRSAANAGDIQVDQPSMSLEEFFLDVVRQAREASVETAGAQSGGRIADYLQAELPLGEETRRAELLSALATPELEEEGVGEEADEAAVQEPHIDEEKLEELAGEGARRETPSAVEGKQAGRPTPRSDKQASERLRRMLDEEEPSEDAREE
ncbi:MAG: ABC transporter ATP-binding protein [Candidatus Pacebacteria bacterium]|nr:ABC transporter ATP-binding protein [Candidatus Paceibacterota bacterium]